MVDEVYGELVSETVLRVLSPEEVHTGEAGGEIGAQRNQVLSRMTTVCDEDYRSAWRPCPPLEDAEQPPRG